MKTYKLYLCLAIVMVLAFGVFAASAEPELSNWDGYYCTSGTCGVNYYNYSYGWNGDYYCAAANYMAPFQAEFVRDVTYPDGTYVMPGSTFTKTWRIRNVGTQAWNTNTKLVYISGDPAVAVNGNVPYYVAPGNTVDISVNVTAPSYGTNVSGQWMLQAPDGTLFGVGCNGQTPIWLSVKTWTNGACSCLGQPVCNCKAPSYKPGRNPYCNNKIREVKDVTYPDGTIVAPGTTFRKTWRMKNGGTCVWDENYLVSFFYGDDLGFDGQVTITPAGVDMTSNSGPKYQVNRPKNIKVYPGDYVYVSVDLKAPMASGMYESYFKLRDNYGYEFGFGSYADSAFWVNVIVADDGKGSSSSSSTASYGSVTSSNTNASYQDMEIPEGTDPALVEVLDEKTAEQANKCGEQSIALKPTETGYEVNWSAVNNGTATWDGYTLVKSDSNPVITLADANIAVPLTAPGETAALSFNINIDSSTSSEDPLWMEFYMNSGEEGFCEFYFEAPAK